MVVDTKKLDRDQESVWMKPTSMLFSHLNTRTISFPSSFPLCPFLKGGIRSFSVFSDSFLHLSDSFRSTHVECVSHLHLESEADVDESKGATLMEHRVGWKGSTVDLIRIFFPVVLCCNLMCIFDICWKEKGLTCSILLERKESGPYPTVFFSTICRLHHSSFLSSTLTSLSWSVRVSESFCRWCESL